jgi:lipid II:glycine glycyltransferase (peptidoglycan interpeptide bridge formation enzyme)
MSPRAKAGSGGPRKARAAAAKPAKTAKPAAAETAATESPDSSPPAPRATRPAVVLPPIEELVRAATAERGQAPPEASDGPGPVAEPAPEPVLDTGPIQVRLATAEELDDWDAHAVASPNGHVYQSRAWADYRAAHGWHTWHLAFDDGFRLLVLGRPRAAGRGTGYGSRGPIPETDPKRSAQRAAAAAELLAGEGIDALTVDGETPASSGLDRLLGEAGFELTEEEQPSRHRMDVRLGPDDAPNSDEKTIFASFGTDTRHRIRQTERHGLRVKRLDAGGGRADEGASASASLVEVFETVDHDDAATVDGMLRTFYGMLDSTAERRGFVLASEDRFLDWAKRSLAVGLMFYLQAEHPEDGPLAGATFYRHGHRLTYALAGDRAELRRTHPGAVRLLVWRAIQIALDERRSIVDLGGVDVEGARGRPDKGDPTYGMYEFKESFGARWVELTGAHRKTMRPMHSLAGRVLDKLAALRR